MDYQQPPTESSPGCGLLGCAGGVLIGLFGGGLFLILLSFMMALNTPIAPATSAASSGPDLRLTIQEDALNRLVSASIEDVEHARVDIVPGNQVSLALETTVSAFGRTIPLQITGIFGLELIDQALHVRLIDSQVAGAALPSELEDFFSSDLDIINQDLNEALSRISDVLGAPITLTGLGTTETELWIEAREGP